MKKRKKPLYIFVHLMKCAGNTILEHVLNNFKEGEILLLYGNRPPYLKKTKKDVKKYIESLKKEQKDKIKVIIGHMTYYGIHELFPNRAARYLTFLREPIKRTISHYNFERTMLRKGIDVPLHTKFITKNNKILLIKEWFSYHEIFHNYIFKFLFIRFSAANSLELYYVEKMDINSKNLELIKKILNKFYFIGIVEKPADFLFIYYKLGIIKFLGNVNVSEQYLTEKEITDAKKMLVPELKFDREIYKYVKKLNRRFKIKHVDFYFMVVYLWFKKIFYYIKKHIKEKEYVRRIKEYVHHLPYRLTLLPLFRLSARFKKISPRYVKLIKFIKDKTGIK